MYGLNVVEVPSRLPNIRIDHEPRLFLHHNERLVSLFLIVMEAHHQGRPVLIGTASVEESQHIFDMLAAPGHSFQLLDSEPGAKRCLEPHWPGSEWQYDYPVGFFAEALGSCTLNKKYTTYR